MIEKNPGILKNAKVIVELNGGVNFSENFEKFKFTLNELQPYMYIPHLTTSLLFDFLRNSDCSFLLKCRLASLYYFSIFRAAPFLFENFQRIGNQYKFTEDIAGGRGLKSDEESIDMIRRMALESAETALKEQKLLIPLSDNDMNNSIMARLKELIVSNGGRVYFLDMPQHSSQEEMFTTEYSLRNREVFYNWAIRNGCEFLNTGDFKYNDLDFPDYFHLGKNRMAEFTAVVFREVSSH
jgi:hypothetical protein